MAEADALKFEPVRPVAAPLRVGEKLRRARERAGIARAELAWRTKINERHLKAIDDGDLAALPARIYAVGFARSYANAVGLDGEDIAAEARRELEARDNRAAARRSQLMDVEDPPKTPSKRLAWLAAALGLLVIAAVATFWRSYFFPSVELPPVRAGDAALAAIAAPEIDPVASQVSPTAESAVATAAARKDATAAAVSSVRTSPSAEPAAVQKVR
jgi:cytoskeletal protein RodZ